MLKLTEMLEYRRPSGSNTENQWIKRYIDRVPEIERDSYGNRFKLGKNRTIIACHTDTVHKTSGMQKIAKSRNGIISVNDRRSNCLGADDTAGVYAALRMIEAGSECTFIFHRAEEIGGHGSEWLATTHEDWLRQFGHCLSLDRRGTLDIIDHQCVGKCCSSEFSSALGMQLGMGHSSNRGTFTDSANYVDIIRECSNLSVGYANEHTPLETLDTDYLERLIERLCRVEWSKLPSVRELEPAMNWFDFGQLDDEEAVLEWGNEGYRKYLI